MKYLNHFFSVLTMLLACLFLMSAMPTNEVSSLKNKPVSHHLTPLTSSEILEKIKLEINHLENKEGHTKKEIRRLKRLKKRISRIENIQSNDKSWVVSLLLALFVGFLGIHRFYLKYTWQGVVQLLTLGGFGIWSFVDLVRIIIRHLQPNQGSYTD